MNKSSIAESFGEQLAIVTKGTQYEIQADTDDDYSITELEQRIRKIMYSLWMDAKSKQLADYLERKMKVHFEQLYEFSYGVTFYDNMDHPTPRKTESLALMVMDEKDSYKRRIDRARLQYERFISICNQISLTDKELIVSYFERSEKVNYEVLRDVMKRNLKSLEQFYSEVEKQKDKQAIEEMRGCTYQEAKEYHSQHNGKEQYFLNGRYVYMTKEKYAAYLDQKEHQMKYTDEIINNNNLSAIEF